jgi:hypothetical protein
MLGNQKEKEKIIALKAEQVYTNVKSKKSTTMVYSSSFLLGLIRVEPHPKKNPRDGAIGGSEPMIALLENDIIGAFPSQLTGENHEKSRGRI